VAGRGESPSGDSAYDVFVREVCHRQLAAWLPKTRQRVVDVSSDESGVGEYIAAAGHEVVHAVTGGAHEPSLRSVHDVVADPARLEWVAPASVDLVVAEGGVLSAALATEVTLESMRDALRPGGRMLLAVDSLLSGLSAMAGQQRWAELADVPAADVVLVTGEDGSITRCFWPEDLATMLDEAGFAVEWIRPRTVLAEPTVTRALEADPGQLPALVETELDLAVERAGESVGNVLVASAIRP